MASDPGTQTISLIRGDYQQFVLPFSFFEPSGDGTGSSSRFNFIISSNVNGCFCGVGCATADVARKRSKKEILDVIGG